MQPNPRKELKPLTAIIGLLIGGVVVVAIVFIGTQTSFISYVHLPIAKPETAAQLQAAQTKAAKKVQSCIKGVQNQWDPAIKYAEAENLPVTTYQTQEQQLEAKCQSN